LPVVELVFKQTRFCLPPFVDGLIRISDEHHFLTAANASYPLGRTVRAFGHRILGAGLNLLDPNALPAVAL